MFSWNIHVVEEGSKFILFVPFHYLALLAGSFFSLVMLLTVLKVNHPWRNLLLFAVLIAAFGFLFYGTELTLDKKTGMATLREFQYFHWSTDTFPLRDIGHVTVRTGSVNDQLSLQFVSGRTRPISFMDQYGGKDIVARKANEFLEAIDGN